MVWGLPRCVWARESTAPAQGNQSLPSPGDFPDPGIEPRSHALQADALPSEPPGKPRAVWRFFKKLEIELPYDPAVPLLGIHTGALSSLALTRCTDFFALGHGVQRGGCEALLVARRQELAGGGGASECARRKPGLWGPYFWNSVLPWLQGTSLPGFPSTSVAAPSRSC